MSDEQIISYCKKNNIKHLNKQGKPYTRKTLIKYINEDVKIEVEEKKPKKTEVEEKKPKKTEVEEKKPKKAEVEEKKPKKIEVKEKKPQKTEVEEKKPKKAEVEEKKPIKAEVKEKKLNIDYFLNLKANYNKVLNQEKYIIIKNIMNIYTSLKRYKYTSKSLSELCEIKYGDKISKTEGEIKKKDHLQYPVYDSGNEPIFYTNKYNRTIDSCKISINNVTYDNCVTLLFDNYFLTNDAFTIKSSNDILLDEYLFVYLYTHRDEIMECVKNNVLNVDKFLSIKINIPVNPEIQDKCYREFYKIWNTYRKIEEINNEIVEILQDIKKGK